MNGSDRPSDRLRRAAAECGTVGAAADRLGVDAPFLLLLVLASLSLVPGAAPVFAGCMVIVGSSLLLGRDGMALPPALRRRPIPRATLERAADRLAGFERRFGARAGGPPVRTGIATALVVWNAVLVILPIPFGNVPPAVAAILLALGVVDRNRRALALGVAATLAATAFESVLVLVGLDLGARLLDRLWG